MSEKTAVEYVIKEYVRGTFEGDTETLKAVFHGQARMNGYLGGQKMLGTPDPFIDVIGNNPSPESAGMAYETEITNIEITGDAASVTLHESGLMGMDFTNYFHLIKEDNSWLIISKLFFSEPLN